MRFSNRISSFFPYFPAIVSGGLLTAAFPNTGLYLGAFLALVPLWVSLGGLTCRQAFGAGTAAGLAHYLTLIYWIIPTLTIYGKLHMILALACLVLLSLYLALYLGMFAFMLKQPGLPPWLTPLWGGIVWVGLEFIRTHALTGFPWGVLGYSQFSNSLLVQTADVGGVLGISFVLVTCNGILALLWNRFRQPAGEGYRINWVLPCTYGLLILAAAFGYGHFRLKTVDTWIAEAPKPVISVIQGNIEQDKKWDKSFKDFTVDRYRQLSLTSDPSTLVVWPETAVPFYYGRDAVYSMAVDDVVREKEAHFLIGSPAAEVGKEIIRYYNRAYMLNPKGLVTASYDKTHLVPFGEYVPLQDLLFFIEKLTAEAGNFSRGKSFGKPLPFREHKTGVLICFEILFPDIARAFVANGADILTTITNDAWFGRTSAPAQHFSIAVLRAVENRRSVVRAANTGISGFIDPAGRITATTGLFDTTSLSAAVPALTRSTFYSR
ncbi:MAG: apolipoprotein N-acyltransferase, partial [Desulfobacterales bacterium]|nr:apolipoprotein N-acyltransferase [Desulfobacterales bacterium]